MAFALSSVINFRKVPECLGNNARPRAHLPHSTFTTVIFDEKMCVGGARGEASQVRTINLQLRNKCLGISFKKSLRAGNSKANEPTKRHHLNRE